MVYLLWLERLRPGINTRQATARASAVSYLPTLIPAAIGLALGYALYGVRGAIEGVLVAGLFGFTVLHIRKTLARAVFPDTLKLVACACATGLACGIAGYLTRDTWNDFKDSRVLARNFYGALRVYDDEGKGTMGPVRILMHGTIDHGEQFQLPQYRRLATTYYAVNSGVGLAIRKLQMTGAINVGVIGLGAGTIATYARPIDRYTFYDINPIVPRIARTQFHFLPDCMARDCSVVMGDARLSLEREPSRQFDVLAVDAFSGDAIPVHLLTRQAFQLYWRHLKPDGVLAVHVSNHYLDLGPVVALSAAEVGKQAMMVSNQAEDDKEIDASDWVLVSSRPGFFEQPEIKGADQKIDPIRGLRTWTDDYSNLYKILR
jgi:SAM-dependent methyltransferase